MTIERRAGVYDIAVQEYKYAKRLHFVAYVSAKPFPKRMTRWSDSSIAEVILERNYEEWSRERWPYRLSWKKGRTTPVESWERGLIGFHNISNRIRTVLGFAPSYTEWREPEWED